VASRFGGQVEHLFRGVGLRRAARGAKLSVVHRAEGHTGTVAGRSLYLQWRSDVGQDQRWSVIVVG
jgi:hypothetical protein